MASIYKSSITIGNQKIDKVCRVYIEQGLGQINKFVLELPVSIENNTIFDSIRQTYYEPITIRLSNKNNSSQKLIFKGLITSVTNDWSPTIGNRQYLTGESTLHWALKNVNNRTFVNKNLDAIVREVMKPYGSDFSNVNIAAKGQTFSFIPQFEQSDFNFLLDLANRDNGYWLLDDGQSFYFTDTLPQKSAIILKAGKNLLRYAVGIGDEFLNVELAGYDDQTGQSNQEKSSQISTGSKHTFAKWAVDKLSQQQSKKQISFTSGRWRRKQDIKTAVKRVKTGQISNLIRMNGQATVPLVPGDIISIAFPKNRKTDPYGKFRVTDVAHEWSGKGQYSNRFSAIPEAAQKPPLYSSSVSSIKGLHEAVVKEVVDGGKVRVTFSWDESQSVSPPLRVLTPFAGKGYGMSWVPNEKERVAVYINSNSEMCDAFVMGSYFHHNALPDSWKANKRGVKSPEGISIMVDDEGKTLRLVAPETIVMEGKNLILKFGEKAFFIGKTALHLFSSATYINCSSSQQEMKSIENSL